MNLLSEEQFEALFGLSEDYVFLLKKVHKSYEYIYLNNATKDVFLQFPIGKTLHECLDEDHMRPIFENYEKAITDRKIITYRDFYLFSDHERMNETTVTPIFHENECYILAVTKEVSRQKEIEEKYLFFQSLLNVSVDPTIVIKTDGTIFDLNPTFEETFGVSLDEWKGYMYRDLPNILDEDKNDINHYLNLVASGIGQSSIVNRRIKANGQIGTFITSYSPITNDGEVIAAFMLLQEITDELRLKEDLLTTTNVLEGYKKGISSAAMVTITNQDGMIDHVNELFVQTSQYEEQELIGIMHHIFDPNLYSFEHYQSFMNKITSNDIWSGEVKSRKKDGMIYWVDTTVIPLVDTNNEIENYLIIEFNITEKKKVLSELRNIEKKFRLITENANDLIAIIDEYGFVLYTSPSHEKRLGLEKEEMLGAFYTDILSEECRKIWMNDLIDRMNEGESITVEFEMICKNGDSFWTESFITPVKDAESSHVFQHVIMSREITERKKLEEKLRYMAYHDNLTQLPNRSFLLKGFPKIKEIAMKHEQSLGLLYIDGDNFKLVNDTYGHDVGDEFLRQFGFALKECIRSEDLISRMGGDEFVIVLTDLPIDADEREKLTLSVIDRIKRTLMEGWQVGGIEFTPTTSMGIAYYPDHGHTLDDLIEKADQSLYEAKKFGKNHIYFYC